MYKNNISINEVLNITNEYYISYYCKNNICVLTSYNYINSYIEIPDKKDNLIKYITDTCNYDDIIINKCHYITKCNSDNECLSNKCYKNHCMFNNETQIIRCDNIYMGPTLFNERSSYMHCGKPFNEKCNNNNECSSKKCVNSYCNQQNNGPNESEGMIVMIYLIILIFILIIFFFIYIIIYKLRHNKQT